MILEELNEDPGLFMEELKEWYYNIIIYIYTILSFIILMNQCAL